MSFLNNGNSRVTPKGPPNDDRSVRTDRDRGESAFGSDLLHNTSDADSASRAPAPYSSDARPTAFGTTAASSLSGPTAADKCTNVIAAGAKWQGTLTVDDSVRIDGTFSGEVDSKGTVHVAEGAQVDAKIRGMYVVVSGEFRGEIRCEQRTDLMPRSRVNGEIFTKVLSVHEGATFDGGVKMSGNLEDARRASAGARTGRPDSESTASPSERRQDRVAAASSNGRVAPAEEI